MKKVISGVILVLFAISSGAETISGVTPNAGFVKLSSSGDPSAWPWPADSQGLFANPPGVPDLSISTAHGEVCRVEWTDPANGSIDTSWSFNTPAPPTTISSRVVMAYHAYRVGGTGYESNITWHPDSIDPEGGFAFTTNDFPFRFGGPAVGNPFGFDLAYWYQNHVLVARLTTAGMGIYYGGVQMGETGAAITGSFRNTITTDIAAVAANACNADIPITVTGAATGAECVVGMPSTTPALLQGTCFVSATNTVQLRICNGTNAASADPANATYSVRVFNP